MSTDIRKGTTFAGGFAAAALAVGLASPVANAQQFEGPVQFWADGNDQCEVEFTVLNSTNGVYPLDWWVEGQEREGDDLGLGNTGQLIDTRNYEPAVPEASYRSDYDVPLTTNVVVNLNDVAGLPPADDGAYVVNYRIAAGPEGDHRGGEYDVAVTGCETEDEGTGSLDLGSLDIMGSLGNGGGIAS